MSQRWVKDRKQDRVGDQSEAAAAEVSVPPSPTTVTGGGARDMYALKGSGSLKADDAGAPCKPT